MSVPVPLTAADVAAALGLDAPTMARLGAHLDLLGRWQPRINLVGAATLADPWRRHILDSAQIAPRVPPGSGRIVDLGAGAGFPGLVLAIVLGRPVELVESDQRKAAFLREAARITAAPARIHAARAESLPPLNAAVVTARALAPLDRLLDWAAPHLAPGGVCLFPKGRDWERELTACGKAWNMAVTTVASQSDPAGVILEIGGLERRDE